MFGMKPVTHKGFSCCSLGLCNLIFMVRKREVHTAGMNIERFAKVLHGHGRALNVPTRAARTDSCAPEEFALFWRLPECEISGIRLVVTIHVYAGAGLDARGIEISE